MSAVLHSWFRPVSWSVAVGVLHVAASTAPEESPRVLHDVLSSMVNHSFVDDITLLTGGEEELQTAFSHIDPFLALTEQKLNANKTYLFGVNVEPFAVCFRSDHLLPKEVLKILGLKFRFATKTVSYQYFPEDLNFLDEACSQIRFANQPFWARDLVIGGSVIF